MAQSKRLSSIEGLRFLMMLMICYWHCYGRNGFLHNGYIAVEWFFILSGMLMYHSCSRHPEEGTLDYTLRKYLRFAPEYLFVMVYCYLRHGVLPVLLGRKPLDFDFLLKSLSESIMLQDCGLYSGGVNFPMWYLCALLWGGSIVHSLLHNFRKAALSLWFPLIVLIGYTYLLGISGNGSLQVWEVVGGIKPSMLRGICGMSLGVLLAHVISQKVGLLTRHCHWLDACSIGAISLFAYFAIADKHYDNYALILICMMLTVCFMGDSLLNRCFKWSGWTLLGALSWQMLLYHGRIVIPIYKTLEQKLNLSLIVGYLLYFAVLMTTCFVLKVAYEKIRTHLI